MTWGVPLLVSYHFAFSYCSWGSQGKSTEVACHSFFQWTTFCQASPPWPAHLGLPAGMACFHWVRQGCGPSVIRLTSFLWVWFQCICLLMTSNNTYHLTWVSLTLMWHISSQLLQQSTAAAPYFGRGVSPYCLLTSIIIWWEISYSSHWRSFEYLLSCCF